MVLGYRGGPAHDERVRPRHWPPGALVGPGWQWEDPAARATPAT